MAARGAADLIEDFASAIPIEVIGNLLAVPHADRGPLRGWAEELLAERRLREEGFFEPGPVREAWTAHLSGRRNDQYRLWVVLMFQAWSERWLR